MNESKREIVSSEVPSPVGTYSQGIVCGGLIFLSGQGPFDASGTRVGVTFAEQVRATFRNLEIVARVAGASLDNVVKLSVFLRDLDDFDEMNRVSRELLSRPFPARTTTQADLRGFDIEVDAILYVPHDD